jgi:hypothetical protein
LMLKELVSESVADRKEHSVRRPNAPFSMKNMEFRTTSLLGLES